MLFPDRFSSSLEVRMFQSQAPKALLYLNSQREFRQELCGS